MEFIPWEISAVVRCAKSNSIYLLLLQFGFGSSIGNTCLIYLLLHTSRAAIYLLLLQDIHPVQQSPALQKSSATSHQPSYL
nr:hypothetical protein CFP56_77483 [Quercus suber]